jgi:hypothetical protein
MEFSLEQEFLLSMIQGRPVFPKRFSGRPNDDALGEGE